MSTAKSSKFKVPALLFHKATGQGYVRLGEQFRYLGRYDDPETQQRYRRLLAQWAASKGFRVTAPPEEITIKELITRYGTTYDRQLTPCPIFWKHPRPGWKPSGHDIGREL